MKYFIFSKLNRNHFLFLSYFIISIIKDIVNRNIKSSKDVIQTFHKYYIISLSDLLSIIPLIIIKIRSKSISNKKQGFFQDQRNDFSFKLFFKNAKKKRIRRIIKLSILVSIFDFLALYINVTYNIILAAAKFVINKVKLTSDILFNVISKFALGTLILHLPIYKHHYLALAINILLLILFLIYDILNITEAKGMIYGLKRIISLVLYSLEDVYAKILLSYDSISPYTYLFFRGIFLNILSLLYSIIFIFVDLPDENGVKSCIFTRLWKVYEVRLNILLYIIILFVIYLFNQNVLLIIDKFSPIHYAVATVLETFGSLIISIIYKEINVAEFFIKFAIYFISILAALIYNEFIVLNFCGFQKYTHLFLLKKANKDLELTILNNNDNDKDKEFFLEDECIEYDESDLYSKDENNENEKINYKKENLNNELEKSNLNENKEYGVNSKV